MPHITKDFPGETLAKEMEKKLVHLEANMSRHCKLQKVITESCTSSSPMQCLLVLMLLIFIQTVTPALAKEELVNTVAGNVRFTRNEKTSQCEVLLEHKPILKIECEFAYVPKITAHFRGTLGRFDEVVVLQENPMGNACNGGPLHLIGLKKDKSYYVSGPLDFCGGKDPIIELQGEIISITFPSGPPNRGSGHIPAERWIFQNGQLKKSRKSF